MTLVPGEVCRAFTVKETSRPRQQFGAIVDRTRSTRAPDPEDRLKLTPFHCAQPWQQEAIRGLDLRPSGGAPVVERFPTFHEDRAADGPRSDGHAEACQDFGDPGRTRLIESRLWVLSRAVERSAQIGGALPVPEPCCPRQLRAIHASICGMALRFDKREARRACAPIASSP